MDEADEIENIKQSAMETKIDYEKFKAINTLADYGKPAIIAIAEIGNSSNSGNIRCHALETILKIKEYSAQVSNFNY